MLLGYYLRKPLYTAPLGDIMAMLWSAQHTYRLVLKHEGMVRNAQLVSALRGAVGDEVDIMLDCWMSWNVPYTIAMASRLEEYEPRWLEEPVLPDKIESYAEMIRFFGDNDGSGTVDQAIDFVAFRNAFGLPSTIFDFNNSGTVDQTVDFVKFRNNFGLTP